MYLIDLVLFVFFKPLHAGSLYNKKTTVDYSTVVSRAWQRPTLPGPFGPSTIGAGGLNGRVRDGYAWNPSAIATKRAFAVQMHYSGLSIAKC